MKPSSRYSSRFSPPKNSTAPDLGFPSLTASLKSLAATSRFRANLAKAPHLQFIYPKSRRESKMNKVKVLLVDDEEEFVSALAERLDIRGIEAHVATDG